jgi:hypothetical protein
MRAAVKWTFNKKYAELILNTQGHDKLQTYNLMQKRLLYIVEFKFIGNYFSKGY